MNAPLRLLFAGALLLAAYASLGPCSAQPSPPREQLLELVPADVGLCVYMSDLRGNAQRWDRAPWVRSLRQLPIVKGIVDSPEAHQLAAFEGELKKHLGLDWPTLRDDLLGDAVVLAYRPAPPGQPEREQGMIALRAAKPTLLAEVVERFDALQKTTGELKALEPLKHRGATYYRRVHIRNTHYYYLHGALLVVAGSEEMLRYAIERDLDAAVGTSPWPERFRRAGARSALVTLAVNPSVIDPFPQPAKGEKRQSFAGFWHALDGAFVTVAADTKLELRVVLQGRSEAMPQWAQPLFTDTPPPSALWQRFPEPAILTVAARMDLAGLAQTVLETLPPAARVELTDQVKLLTRLDLVRDVLPNLGPDWGVCVLPPQGAAELPQLIAALAVKPGSGVEPVDEMLFKSAQLLAGLAVLDHNRKNPGDPIKVESLQEGPTAIKFLTHAKLFPPGFRPACALKEGFLVLASSPAAILRFGPRETAPSAQGETPLLRLSPPELSRLLRLRRGQVVLHFREKHQLSAEEAERNLDQLLGLLDIFDSITLTQRSEPGQASWALRVLPRSQ
jgi:hypothetical protein